MSRAWHRMKLGIVTATFSLCGAAVLVRPTAPRHTPAPRPQELYAAVMQAVDALRDSDYSSAYRHVSLAMQERYPEQDFAEYIRIDHPDLSRFERIEFGALSYRGRDGILVPAYFFLRNGEIAMVQYSLVRESGSWKIDSCRLERRWGRGHRMGGERT